MPDWSIKIVSTGAHAAFMPDLLGAKPGDPLQTHEADLVTWNNTTGNQHQITVVSVLPTDPAYQPDPKQPGPDPALNFQTDPIPAGQSSRPDYNITQPRGNPAPQTWTINYKCKLHANEQGVILASVIPVTVITAE